MTDEHVTIFDVIELAKLGEEDELLRLISDPVGYIAEQGYGTVLLPREQNGDTP